MKKIVRTGVFETNSSSTHSLSIVTGEDFDAWVEDPNLFFIEEDEIFATREEVIKRLEENSGRSFESIYSQYEEYYADDYEDDYREFNSVREFVEFKIFYENGIYSHEEWLEYEDFGESFERRYTTKSGDEVVAFGYYTEG